LRWCSRRFSAFFVCALADKTFGGMSANWPAGSCRLPKFPCRQAWSDGKDGDSMILVLVPLPRQAEYVKSLGYDEAVWRTPPWTRVP
jgi:hypothetical protein